jgi:DNA-binding response OmpR family regulator
MILIVEDNERLARLLSLTFKKMEWSSHLAQNGVDAYRLVR